MGNPPLRTLSRNVWPQYLSYLSLPLAVDILSSSPFMRPLFSSFLLMKYSASLNLCKDEFKFSLEFIWPAMEYNFTSSPGFKSNDAHDIAQGSLFWFICFSDSLHSPAFIKFAGYEKSF